MNFTSVEIFFTKFTVTMHGRGLGRGWRIGGLGGGEGEGGGVEGWWLGGGGGGTTAGARANVPSSLFLLVRGQHPNPPLKEHAVAMHIP